MGQIKEFYGSLNLSTPVPGSLRICLIYLFNVSIVNFQLIAMKILPRWIKQCRKCSCVFVFPAAIKPQKCWWHCWLKPTHFKSSLAAFVKHFPTVDKLLRCNERWNGHGMPSHYRYVAFTSLVGKYLESHIILAQLRKIKKYVIILSYLRKGIFILWAIHFILNSMCFILYLILIMLCQINEYNFDK